VKEILHAHTAQRIKQLILLHSKGHRFALRKEEQNKLNRVARHLAAWHIYLLLLILMHVCMQVSVSQELATRNNFCTAFTRSLSGFLVGNLACAISGMHSSKKVSADEKIARKQVNER
jgi:hypothetical protein